MGKGPATALDAAMAMAEGYGFSVTNYDYFVGTADLNDKERHLDILSTSGCGSGRRRLGGDTAI